MDGGDILTELIWFMVPLPLKVWRLFIIIFFANVSFLHSLAVVGSWKRAAAAVAASMASAIMDSSAASASRASRAQKSVAAALIALSLASGAGRE